MTISPGARLGPYEIHSLLGAGGMGEVYRARDPRLGRDVALKVLPGAFASDPDRLGRFEQEARSVAALNHTNIIAIYDVGHEDGRHFLVTELLEGETLRARLARGPIPPRLAVSIALQIARGLAAAHDKGIVHRDLKPENLFLASDRRVKILDFGLAKLTAAGPVGSAVSTVAVGATHLGAVLGTVGYMAPEQVKGEPTDHRADIFAFGAILYEMLTGERAFHAATAAETMTAILRADPFTASAATPARAVPPGLERVARHCLEKEPAERYQSAHDLAFHLQVEADSGGEATAHRTAADARRKAIAKWLVPAMLLLGLTGGILAGRPFWSREAPKPPEFRRVTFRPGFVWSGRFGPDGRSIVYSAAWGEAPLELFSTRPESPESRSLGMQNASILSISKTGEMAVLVRAEYAGGWAYRGTLARLPLEGGAPREIANGVLWADWDPKRADLAVVREAEGKRRLEFPIGNVLYETAGSIRDPRFSPSGDLIAFSDHRIFGDDQGAPAVVDRSGRMRRLTGTWKSLQGIAWSPDGNEVWFTAASEGPIRALYAVTRAGKVRTVLSPPGSLSLHDISRDGNVLLAEWRIRYGIAGHTASDRGERDLSWLDWSAVRDLSKDGQEILFSEGGEGGGPAYGVYVRKTDGSPAVRLGEGETLSLSPDGKWVLSVERGDKPHPVLLPTGPGQAKALPAGAIHEYQNGSFLPSGDRVLLQASERGRGARYYVQSLNGGNPDPVTPEGVTGFGFGAHTVSPDGKAFAARNADGTIAIWPLGAGPPAKGRATDAASRPVAGLDPDEFPIRWGSDGHTLYTALPAPGRRALQLAKIDLRTGGRTIWKDLVPADAVGATRIGSSTVSADGSTYAYTYGSHVSDLYLVEGLK
jgi:serine/threonine protein kinase/Tol biopolymer transport system component